MIEKLGLWWNRFKTRRKMNRVFSRGEDPYRYRSSPYELARLEAMSGALGARSWRSALEVGCAEGAFTERLASRAGELTAIDISGVALARARARIAPGGAQFVEADIRDWSPADGARFDLIVLGDVLYYLDKPMVAEAFKKTFHRIAGWLSAGGRLILAHGFAGPVELAHRRSFRERFEALGLRLVDERIIDGGPSAGGVSCLLSVLEAAS